MAMLALAADDCDHLAALAENAAVHAKAADRIDLWERNLRLAAAMRAAARNERAPLRPSIPDRTEAHA